MRELKAAGTSIVFITHKLREVRAVADTITVIRRGTVIDTVDPATSESELASLMVGRPVEMQVAKDPAEPGDTGFEIENVTLLDAGNRVVLDDVSLDVRRGEIVVVAGVQGNGQTELTETILGLHRPARGSLRLDGRDITRRSVKGRLTGGLGFVPEDRSEDGVIGSFSIAENYILDLYDSAPFASGPTMRPAEVARNAEERTKEFDVRLTSVHDPISTLSGGNQQKVVMAREMSKKLRLFVASQPTRGVDVGSIEFMHQRIVAERDAGTPVLIVSTELDEVVALADRIAVMYRGRIVGVVPGDTDRDTLGLMMAGVPADEAAAAAAEHHTTLGIADTEEAS
jgi:simple sugar transport system ATP-binding protein